MILIDDKLIEYAEKFRIAFGYMISLRMFPLKLSNDELCAAIDDCIRRGVDDLVEKLCVFEENILL